MSWDVIAFLSKTGGLVLFAVLTLVMDVFKTGYYSSFSQCLTAIKITYPIVQAMFVIVQVSVNLLIVLGIQRTICQIIAVNREMSAPFQVRKQLHKHALRLFQV